MKSSGDDIHKLFDAITVFTPFKFFILNQICGIYYCLRLIAKEM